MQNRWFHSRSLPLLVMALAGLMAFNLNVYAAEKMVALVTDARGTVEMNAGNGWGPAAIMTVVPGKAKIKLATGARAVLSFATGGVVATLTGPCTVLATQDGVTVVEGAATSVQTKKAQGRSTALLPGNVNMDRMGGGRLRSGVIPAPPPLAVTVDPFILTTTPSVTWYARQKYDSFHVVLQDAATHAVVFQQEAPGTATEVKVPAGKLGWNKKYDIYLTARRGDVTDRPPLAEGGDPWRFTVVEQQFANELQQARAEAMDQFTKDRTNVGPLTLILSNYIAQELWTPALEVSQTMVQARPDDANLCRVMGYIYGQKYQTDKAKAMYRKAGDAVPDSTTP